MHKDIDFLINIPWFLFTDFVNKFTFKIVDSILVIIVGQSFTRHRLCFVYDNILWFLFTVFFKKIICNAFGQTRISTNTNILLFYTPSKTFTICNRPIDPTVYSHIHIQHSTLQHTADSEFHKSHNTKNNTHTHTQSSQCATAVGRITLAGGWTGCWWTICVHKAMRDRCYFGGTALDDGGGACRRGRRRRVFC